MTLRLWHVATGFLLLTVIALVLADLDGMRPDPWLTLAAMGQGLLSPDFSDIGGLARATGLTLAFGFCGVAVGATLGLLLAPLYHRAPVRWLCVSVRAVHELFWALLLLNVTGLSPLTGVLAIGLPYAGIFAKVFAEYMEEAPDPLPPGTGAAVAVLWARLPGCLPQMRTYTLYRLECGLRSSAVLGFVGLPTLGFQLETFFRQAEYGSAAACLMIFLGLILPMRRWMVWRLAPLYLGASIMALAWIAHPPMGDGALMRFLWDVLPAPLRSGTEWGGWLHRVFVQQALPGSVATMVTAQLALAGAAVLSLIAFPIIVPRVTGRVGALVGHGVLVVVRSLPEYMMAFVFLQVFGLSLLPAVLALALHNGAIIAHLMGWQAAEVPLRPDAPHGLTLVGWELLPRMSGNFVALCLYRWEIIVRESAIVGLLGIGTLGFYFQTNVQELRLDRVVALLAVAIVITLVIDGMSRRLRAAMGSSGALRIEGRRGQVVRTT
ncbi:phosphonate transport system permease protein [Jannaschia faecimaris]|uniref:Phosphonate transport system permease protein n=1 Tax=Jannaschia faecimaris TaxID=1244108 RepID=A0A1H3TCM6_9RHOB|nr:ABC transporter permease [Jannaschia faecimaris]SDZ47707.1 phosphonate transport system permease protein [Jannaschia faecimaris]